MYELDYKPQDSHHSSCRFHVGEIEQHT